MILVRLLLFLALAAMAVAAVMYLFSKDRRYLRFIWQVVKFTVVILAVVLILFGAKKLPELAKGLGSGIKEFKKATREVTDEIHSAMDDSPAPPSCLPANTTPSQPDSQPPASPSSPPGPKA